MAQADPWRIAAVEAIWVSALFYLLTLPRPARLNLRQAIVGGMWMNAATSGTWNLINGSLFAAFPNHLVLPDMAWHILVIGPVAGACLALIYNRTEAKRRSIVS